LRLSPTPPTSAPSPAPTEADRAQAAATAEVLAALIGDCDAQLADLAAAHAHAAQNGALRAAGAIRIKALHVRGDLEALHAMRHRLIARFGAHSLRAAVPTA
jgi:hypothetical protein